MLVDPLRLKSAVSRIIPDVIEQSGHTQDDAHPYRLWQSFSLPGTERGVRLSVDCERRRNGFQMSGKITDSDGQIIAEFPALQVDGEALAKGGVEGEKQKSAMNRWVLDIDTMANKHAEAIVRALRSRDVH